MKKRIGVLDIAVTLVIMALTVLFCLSVIKDKQSSYVKISSPEGTFLYPISEDASYTINGKLGVSIIEVRDKKVSFVESPCPNKNCITDGSISSPGAFLACLPNGVYVTITGNGEVDDISF